MVNLPVKPTDLILEIGSGHNPHPRSDVLVDRELTDDSERQRRKLRVDRPLVIADGQHLPFQDKRFDFIYCAQVLEHTKDPLQFIKELGRVGKKGLIVVPHVVRERLFGWPYHRWYFWQDKGRILFAPKGANETLPHAPLTHQLFEKTLWFRRQISRQEKQLNIYYLWKGEPRLRRANAGERAKQLKRADDEVRGILEGLELNRKKDLWFWVKWMGARLVRKGKRVIWKISNS